MVELKGLHHPRPYHLRILMNPTLQKISSVALLVLKKVEPILVQSSISQIASLVVLYIPFRSPHLPPDLLAVFVIEDFLQEILPFDRHRYPPRPRHLPHYLNFQEL